MKVSKKRRKKGTGLRMVYNGTQSVDKRENPRVNVEVLTVLSPSSNKDSVITGQIQNISLGGIGVRAKAPSSFSGIFRMGDEVEFSTAEDYFEFHGAGWVAWTSPPGDMAGIWFGQLSEENNKVLEQVLRLPHSPARIWKGKVRAEGVEMIASVHLNLPAYNKPGKWHGTGIAERSWKNQSRPDLIETNIGMMKILKQISEPGGLFAIEFKGMGVPKGPLAAETGILMDSGGSARPAGRFSSISDRIVR